MEAEAAATSGELLRWLTLSTALVTALGAAVPFFGFLSDRIGRKSVLREFEMRERRLKMLNALLELPIDDRRRTAITDEIGHVIDDVLDESRRIHSPADRALAGALRALEWYEQPIWKRYIALPRPHGFGWVPTVLFYYFLALPPIIAAITFLEGAWTDTTLDELGTTALGALIFCIPLRWWAISNAQNRAIVVLATQDAYDARSDPDAAEGAPQ